MSTNSKMIALLAKLKAQSEVRPEVRPEVRQPEIDLVAMMANLLATKVEPVVKPVVKPVVETVVRQPKVDLAAMMANLHATTLLQHRVQPKVEPTVQPKVEPYSSFSSRAYTGDTRTQTPVALGSSGDVQKVTALIQCALVYTGQKTYMGSRIQELFYENFMHLSSNDKDAFDGTMHKMCMGEPVEGTTKTTGGITYEAIKNMCIMIGGDGDDFPSTPSKKGVKEAALKMLSTAMFYTFSGCGADVLDIVKVGFYLPPVDKFRVLAEMQQYVPDVYCEDKVFHDKMKSVGLMIKTNGIDNVITDRFDVTILMKGGPKFMFTACQLNQVLRNLGAVFIVQKKDEERQNGVTLKKYAYQAIFGAIFPAAKTKTV